MLTVIYFSMQSSTLSEAVKKGQAAPYIFLERCGEEWQGFLIVDKTIVCELPLNLAPIVLLSSFYVFDIQYPVGCHNAYSFLEYLVFGSSVKVSPSVKHFVASLHS